MSNNLDLTQVAANQTNKEIAINDATGQLDAALTEGFSASVASGNYAINNANFRRNLFFTITGAATGGREFQVPAIKKLFIVHNSSTTHAILVDRGATQISVPALTTFLFYADGTTDGLTALNAVVGFESISAGPGTFTGNAKELLRVNAGATAVEYVSAAYDIGMFFPGVPVALSEVNYLCARAFTLPDNFAGSCAYAVTADATGVVFDVKKNGSTIGTITFSAASNTATFATSGSGDESFAAGDRLTIAAPASLGTLADVSFTLLGTRND